jgi:hypothetical protein
MNQPNLAYVIGTSVRSDLGVGKQHLYPGPGDYEVDDTMQGPYVGFGTEEKKTKIKKTFAPGPSSYQINPTVGNIPVYLKEGQNVNMQPVQ